MVYRGLAVVLAVLFVLTCSAALTQTQAAVDNKDNPTAANTHEGQVVSVANNKLVTPTIKLDSMVKNTRTFSARESGE